MAATTFNILFKLYRMSCTLPCKVNTTHNRKYICSKKLKFLYFQYFQTSLGIKLNFAYSQRFKNFRNYFVISNWNICGTSDYTLEERIVASIWIHERLRTGKSMRQVRDIFEQQFGKESPSKQTLLGNENFSKLGV